MTAPAPAAVGPNEFEVWAIPAGYAAVPPDAAAALHCDYQLVGAVDGETLIRPGTRPTGAVTVPVRWIRPLRNTATWYTVVAQATDAAGRRVRAIMPYAQFADDRNGRAILTAHPEPNTPSRVWSWHVHRPGGTCSAPA